MAWKPAAFAGGLFRGPDTLRRRTVTLAISVLAPALAVAGLLLWSLELQARRSLTEQLEKTARAMSLVVDRQFGEKTVLLDALAVSPELLRGDFAAFDRQARRAMTDRTAWIVVHDHREQQLVNTRAPPGAVLPVTPVSPDRWAGERQPGVRVTNLVLGPVAKAHVIGVSRMVVLDDGRRVRLGVTMLAHDFDRIFVDQRLPGRWTGSVIDARNSLVARNRDGDRFIGRKASPDMQAAIARASSGVVRTSTLDGIKTLSAFSRLPGYHWTVLVGVPRNEFNLVGGGALVGTAGLAFIMLAVGILMALRAAHRIEQPVQALAAAVRGWGGAGGFVAPDAPGPREIQDLAAGFGMALGALEGREASLRDSEARLQLALRASGSGMWEWDVASREVIWSPEMFDLLGRPEEGQDLHDYWVGLVHPEDRATVHAMALQSAETGEPLSAEFRVWIGPSRKLRWLRSHAMPGPGAGGPYSRLVGVNLDVTDIRANEAALEDANASLSHEVAARTRELDQVWRLSRDAFLIADAAGVWLRASPAWTTLLGWREDELIGRTWEWMEHPDDRARSLAEHARLAAGQVVTRFENRFRTRSGDYRWFSWTAVPDQGLSYFVARDITAEKEAAFELERAQEALRQAQKMDAMGQLTGGVAHDFNNLLTPILGALDIVRRRAELGERDARLLTAASDSAERARILVQRLLAFARRQPLQPRPVDVAELLQGVTTLLSSTLGPRVRVVLQIEDGLPSARGDVNQLEMALLNLAVNARDAMPDGGTVAISASAIEVPAAGPDGLRRGSYVRIVVADTGAGMDEATLARAIEPFFSTKGVGKGTGLGLSMVHGLAAQLGGALKISSTLGQGARVELWLPVSGAPTEGGPGPLDSEPELQGAGVVLLVDDEHLVRLTTSDMLAGLGYSVVEAEGGREALSLIEGGLRPALLITDHLMPEMTGVELAQGLRAQHPDLPVLLVSGYADVEGLPTDLPRLRKPFLQSELAAQVAALVRPAPVS